MTSPRAKEKSYATVRETLNVTAKQISMASAKPTQNVKTRMISTPGARATVGPGAAHRPGAD
jgi:hypothetical protein